VGIRNSALTPHIQPRLEETSFTLPHRTSRNLRGGLPSRLRLWAAQVPSPRVKDRGSDRWWEQRRWLWWGYMRRKRWTTWTEWGWRNGATENAGVALQE